MATVGMLAPLGAPFRYLSDKRKLRCAIEKLTGPRECQTQISAVDSELTTGVYSR